MIRIQSLQRSSSSVVNPTSLTNDPSPSRSSKRSDIFSTNQVLPNYSSMPNRLSFFQPSPSGYNPEKEDDFLKANKQNG